VCLIPYLKQFSQFINISWSWYLELLNNIYRVNFIIVFVINMHIMRFDNWLLGSNSELSVHNKLTLYKQVIRPVWSYGIQLWGCASDSNIQVIQRYQNKVLKCIVNAPWYFWNCDLHRDLGIETVTDIIVNFAKDMKRDFKTTSTLKRPDFSTWIIWPEWMYLSFNYWVVY
jgi:hypothetical protein